MKIKIRSLLITVGIGFVIQILLFLVTDPFIGRGGIARWSPFFILLATIAIGMIYSFLANREERLTMLSGILGGAIAVIIVSALQAIFLVIYRWLEAPSVAAAWSQDLLRINPLLVVMGILVSFFGGLAISGIIGAVGGAIGMFLVGMNDEDQDEQVLH